MNQTAINLSLPAESIKSNNNAIANMKELVKEHKIKCQNSTQGTTDEIEQKIQNQDNNEYQTEILDNEDFNQLSYDTNLFNFDQNNLNNLLNNNSNINNDHYLYQEFPNPSFVGYYKDEENKLNSGNIINNHNNNEQNQTPYISEGNFNEKKYQSIDDNNENIKQTIEEQFPLNHYEDDSLDQFLNEDQPINQRFSFSSQQLQSLDQQYQQEQQEQSLYFSTNIQQEQQQQQQIINTQIEEQISQSENINEITFTTTNECEMSDDSFPQNKSTKRGRNNKQNKNNNNNNINHRRLNQVGEQQCQETKNLFVLVGPYVRLNLVKKYPSYVSKIPLLNVHDKDAKSLKYINQLLEQVEELNDEDFLNEFRQSVQKILNIDYLKYSMNQKSDKAQYRSIKYLPALLIIYTQPSNTFTSIKAIIKLIKNLF